MVIKVNMTAQQHWKSLRVDGKYCTVRYKHCHVLRYNTTQTQYNTILYNTILYYTTLHYTTLHYTTLHYTTLHYTIIRYTILRYTTLHYTTLHYTTLHYTTLHYTTLHYTTLHYTTPCTTLHYTYYPLMQFIISHLIILPSYLKENVNITSWNESDLHVHINITHMKNNDRDCAMFCALYY